MMSDKVIVLRTVKYGESDLIIHAINREGARRNFFAIGALRSRRRFGSGVLEPTHYIEVTYQASRRTEGPGLDSLQEAMLIQDFTGLRTSYARLEMGLYFVQQVHRVTLEESQDSHEIFDILGNALDLAQTSPRLDLLKSHFDVKLMYALGILGVDSLVSHWLKLPLRDHLQMEEQDLDLISLQSRLQSAFADYSKASE